MKGESLRLGLGNAQIFFSFLFFPPMCFSFFSPQEANKCFPFIEESVDDEKVSLTSSYVKQKELEAKQANERLLQLEEEHRQKELELEKITAKLQLLKQRAEEA